MLVHIVEAEYDLELKSYDYDHYKVLACKTIDTYDQFITFIKNYHGMKINIDNKMYCVDDYVYSFPADFDSVPVLRIYVYEY